MLGLAGSALGVGLAALAMRAIPSLLAGATPGVEISYGLTLPAVLQGLGIGLLVSLLFSLVPLLDVRHVKPSLLLRDEPRPRRLDVHADCGDGVRRGRPGWPHGVAGRLAAHRIDGGRGIRGDGDRAAPGRHAADSRAGAAGASAKSFALRHAVLQLRRPGSQMRIVLLAVGLGSFFIIGVRSLQENLIAQFAVNINAGFAGHVPARHPAGPGGAGARGDRGAPGAGGRAATPAAGAARARGRRRGPRGQSRGLRRCARPRLARPGIHHHLSQHARSRTRRVVAGAIWEPTPSPEAGSLDRAVHQRVVQDQHRRHDALRRARPRHLGQGHQRAVRRMVRQPRRRVHVRVPPGRARTGAAQLHRVRDGPADAARRARACRRRWSAPRRTCR